MEKGKIRRLKEPLSEELKEMEEYFISEAENSTEEYLSKYIQLPSSFAGNYICSDLFKETFDAYHESTNSRKKYASVIHNSAAVLANEMFQIKSEDSHINKCIFVTGVPGAGKSFLIQSLLLANQLSKDIMIYEGDITTDTIYEKMRKVIEKGMDVYIIVVNPTLELAQENAITRHFEVGRGASCETMARILSNIPNALTKIRNMFPDIELGIYNKTSNYDINYYLGWDNIELLNHGTYDEILRRLQEIREKYLQEYDELNKTISMVVKK